MTFYLTKFQRLQTNRLTNQVYDPSWIRGQMCNNNTNYLLRGNYSITVLTPVLCNLNDSQLVNLFESISSGIDFTKTKEKVKFFICKQFFFVETLMKNESAFLIRRRPTPHRRCTRFRAHFPDRSTHLWCSIYPHCDGWQCSYF